MRGVSKSEIVKLKMSHSRKRIKLSESHKNNISLSITGRIVSLETKLKMSFLKKGKPNGRLGKTHSEENKRKID
jgi:hypothetical protein